LEWEDPLFSFSSFFVILFSRLRNCGCLAAEFFQVIFVFGWCHCYIDLARTSFSVISSFNACEGWSNRNYSLNRNRSLTLRCWTFVCSDRNRVFVQILCLDSIECIVPFHLGNLCTTDREVYFSSFPWSFGIYLSLFWLVNSAKEVFPLRSTSKHTLETPNHPSFPIPAQHVYLSRHTLRFQSNLFLLDKEYAFHHVK